MLQLMARLFVLQQLQQNYDPTAVLAGTTFAGNFSKTVKRKHA
jgi:hypothetical protein